MTPVDRRAFLQGAAAVSAAAAIPSPLSPPSHPAPVTPTSPAQAGVSWHRVPCRLCGVGCGMLIGVANGRVVGAKGDPESPVSNGLGCVKGYHAPQALFGRDRITQPMVRRDGALVPVSLNEAYDLIARRLKEALDAKGKHGVGLYGSAQWTVIDAYVAGKLMKGGLGTNNVDTSARLHAGAASAGARSTFGLDGPVGGYQDIDHADIFVLWDANLSESDPVLFSRMLERRRRDPAVRIVDLATRTTRTSYAADRSILMAPHSVVAIANAICHELIAADKHNREHIAKSLTFHRGRTEFEGNGLTAEEDNEVGWSDVEAFLEEYDARRSERHSGVPAAAIRWLASLYGDPTKRVLSIWGPSLSADVRGTWNNNVLYNIHLLTGKLAEPGNGALCLTGQPNGGWATHDAGSLAETLPRGRVAVAEDRQLASGIWSVPADRIDAAPGLPLLSMFQALESGDLRFLWIQATNPMLSLPHLDRYRRAAGLSDRFIVVTEAYPTPTTDVADVVLPAALWLEREGVYVNGGRRVQYFSRSAAPPGAAASDAWHMIEVAKRLGLGDLFPWDQGALVEGVWTEYQRFHADPATALPTLDTLKTQAGAEWPSVEGQETEWRYRPGRDPAADPAHGALDFYGHPDHRARIWLRPHQAPAEAPDDRYSFWLTTGVVLEHFGGGAMTRRIPPLNRGLPHSYVEIHREDAAALGIRDRDTVRVSSRRGSIDTEARIDYRSQPPRGLVFMPNFDEGVPVSRLMGDAVCPLSGQPDHTCAVRIERVGGRRSA